MQPTGGVHPSPERRHPTGMPGLDEILFGGLIPRRSYLLVGAAGSGKTVFALQWLRAVQRQDRRVLYLTLAEPAADIVRNMDTFGWRLDGIELLDFTPSDVPDNCVNADYQIFAPGEVEQTPIWRAIYQPIQDQQPACLVIDSLTQLHYLSTSEYQFRQKMLSLVGFLNRSG